MIIEDTCTPKCAWYKKYRRRDMQTCPNFMETTWTADNLPGPKIVCDCAPKRALILQIEAFNRMLGLQQAAEKERNMQHTLIKTLVSYADVQGTPIPIEGDIVTVVPQIELKESDEDRSNPV